MQTATSAGGGLTTTLDIAALVSAVIWPLLLLVCILVFRDRLVDAAKWLARRQIKSLSIGGVSLEFAEAKPLTLQLMGAVDLRHAGQSGDVNDSTLRSFYAQISDPSTLDYAVVDLGGGREWLTSRLFILSVILARMRGLRALVFVETAGHVRRRLVGISECEAVRWRLAMRFPWLEAALAHAECTIWPRPADVLSSYSGRPAISNELGRLEWPGGSPEPAAELLRAFLNGIQMPAGVPPSDEWEALPASNPSSPPMLERARWLTSVEFEQLMGTALNQSSISLSELTVCGETAKARLLLAQTGRWVALSREERVFERLVDRVHIIEAVARTCVQSVEP